MSMAEREEDSYGVVKAPEPIRVETHGPFVVSTPFPNAAPIAAKQAFFAMVRKDLASQVRPEN